MKKMQIIGLTGSIGMGKSTAAEILRHMGFPIYSADAAVHDVLKKGGSAVARINKAFPGVVRNGAVDRALLGQAVFGKPAKLKALEKIVHPLIKKAERDFLAKARKAKKRAAIIEIPLLFETGGEARCDVTLVVTAPKRIQQKRVLARPGMTKEKMNAILARQMPDAEKRKKAGFTVPTGGGLGPTAKHLHKILQKLDLVD